jgi:hypothetical protein
VANLPVLTGRKRSRTRPMPLAIVQAWEGIKEGNDECQALSSNPSAAKKKKKKKEGNNGKQKHQSHSILDGKERGIRFRNFF